MKKLVVYVNNEQKIKIKLYQEAKEILIVA